MDDRYTCNLGGICEEDSFGRQTLQQCQETCRRLEGEEDTKEIAYQVYTYIPGDAHRLAPSDRVEVIRRIIGVRPRKEISNYVLQALANNDILYLWNGRGFNDSDIQRVRDYLVREYNLDTLDLFLIQALYQESPGPSYDWKALRNKVEWELENVFSESSLKLSYLLEDPEVESYQHLVNVVQRFIFQIPLEMIWIEDIEQNYDDDYFTGLLPYWDWILETYGPEIPHQDLIRHNG